MAIEARTQVKWPPLMPLINYAATEFRVPGAAYSLMIVPTLAVAASNNTWWNIYATKRTDPLCIRTGGCHLLALQHAVNDVT